MPNQHTPPTTIEEYAERFWSRVDKSGDCWIWTSTKAHWGYGRFIAKGLDRRERLTHRWSWFFTHGPIPDGMSVLHSCDNPPCVNPAHLSLGTDADNMRERDERGRHWARRGSEHGQARLTEDEVRRIKRVYVPGDRTYGQSALARQYGVSQRAVRCIVMGTTWGHVEP